MSSLALSIIGIAYFLGSFPTGYVTGRLRGIDVRKHGSGNIGATNVLRVLGKPWGFSVFFLDAFKGFLAVRIALALVERHPVATQHSELFAILAAAVCVFGHSFPIWLGFRGGKGVATSAGSLFGVVPIAALTIFLVWLLVFFVTRYVSLASIIGALVLPISVAVLMWLHLTRGVVLIYFSTAMTALVVWRHRANIVRLLNGTEPRFSRK